MPGAGMDVSVLGGKSIIKFCNLITQPLSVREEQSFRWNHRTTDSLGIAGHRQSIKIGNYNWRLVTDPQSNIHDEYAIEQISRARTGDSGVYGARRTAVYRSQSTRSNICGFLCDYATVHSQFMQFVCVCMCTTALTAICDGFIYLHFCANHNSKSHPHFFIQSNAMWRNRMFGTYICVTDFIGHRIEYDWAMAPTQSMFLFMRWIMFALTRR